MSIYPRQARRQCRKCTLFTLHLIRKFLEFDFAAAATIIRSKKELWFDLRQVYPDMGGTNREIGLLIQLCHDMDKAPSAADKALMRLTINNMSGALSREQKVNIQISSRYYSWLLLISSSNLIFLRKYPCNFFV